MRITRLPLNFYPGLACNLPGKHPIKKGGDIELRTIICLGDELIPAPAGMHVKILAEQNGRILLERRGAGYVWSDFFVLVSEERQIGD